MTDEPQRDASGRSEPLPMGAEELHFYLAGATRYAEIALRDGNDPESVLMNVWGQLANLKVAVLDGADSETLINRELAGLREVARALLQGLTRLIDPSRSIPEATSADDALLAMRQMAKELVVPYAQKLPTGHWSISLERERPDDERQTDTEDRRVAPFLGGAGGSERPVAAEARPRTVPDRYADARTLLEITYGAEFGLTAEPVSVAQRLRGLEGPLVGLQLAGGEGRIWINPRVVRLLRPGPQLEETNHNREGSDEDPP